MLYVCVSGIFLCEVEFVSCNSCGSYAVQSWLWGLPGLFLLPAQTTSLSCFTEQHTHEQILFKRLNSDNEKSWGYFFIFILPHDVSEIFTSFSYYLTWPNSQHTRVLSPTSRTRTMDMDFILEFQTGVFMLNKVIP